MKPGRELVGSAFVVVLFGVSGVILRWLHGMSGVGLNLIGCVVTWFWAADRVMVG